MNELSLDPNSLRDGFVGKGYKRGAIVGVKKESKVVGLVEGHQAEVELVEADGAFGDTNLVGVRPSNEEGMRSS